MRQMRENRGLSRQQLAEILNVDRGTVRRWENDQRRPNRAETNKLCEFFDCSVADLWDDDPALWDILDRISTILRDMSPDARNAFVSALEASSAAVSRSAPLGLHDSVGEQETL